MPTDSSRLSLKPLIPKSGPGVASPRSGSPSQGKTGPVMPRAEILRKGERAFGTLKLSNSLECLLQEAGFKNRPQAPISPEFEPKPWSEFESLTFSECQELLRDKSLVRNLVSDRDLTRLQLLAGEKNATAQRAFDALCNQLKCGADGASCDHLLSPDPATKAIQRDADGRVPLHFARTAGALKSLMESAPGSLQILDSKGHAPADLILPALNDAEEQCKVLEHIIRTDPVAAATPGSCDGMTPYLRLAPNVRKQSPELTPSVPWPEVCRLLRDGSILARLRQLKVGPMDNIAAQIRGLRLPDLLFGLEGQMVRTGSFQHVEEGVGRIRVAWGALRSTLVGAYSSREGTADCLSLARALLLATMGPCDERSKFDPRAPYRAHMATLVADLELQIISQLVADYEELLDDQDCGSWLQNLPDEVCVEPAEVVSAARHWQMCADCTGEAANHISTGLAQLTVPSWTKSLDLGAAYADLVNSGACADAYDLLNIARPPTSPQDVVEACFGRLHAAFLRAFAVQVAPKVQARLIELLIVEQSCSSPSIELIPVPEPVELWERAESVHLLEASESWKLGSVRVSRAVLDFASNTISFRIGLQKASAFQELHNRLRNLDWGLDGAMLVGIQNGLRGSRNLSCASDARGHSCSLTVSLLVNLCTAGVSPVLVNLRLEYAKAIAWDAHLRLLGELVRGDFDHPWLRVPWERLVNALVALGDAEECEDIDMIERTLYEARAEKAPQERLDRAMRRMRELELKSQQP